MLADISIADISIADISIADISIADILIADISRCFNSRYFGHRIGMNASQKAKSIFRAVKYTVVSTFVNNMFVPAVLS